MRHIAVSMPIPRVSLIDPRREAPARTRLLGSASRLALSLTSAVLASAIFGVALPGEAGAQAVVNPVQTTTYTLSTNPTIFGGTTNIDVSTGNAVVGDTTPFDVTVQGGANIKTTDSLGTGIDLLAGGNVTNQAGGSISGGRIGVAVEGAGGSVTNQANGTISSDRYGVVLSVTGAVTNAGTITGTLGFGVELEDGGSVTNQADGTISGGRYGVVLSGTGAIANAGIITGTTSAGIFLDTGSVTNQAGGTISGGNYGVHIANGAGTVTNAGSITGTTRDGVSLGNGGSVTNQAGGSISGAINGVAVFDGSGSVTNQVGGTISGGQIGVRIADETGTVVNSGTIAGTSRYGISLGSGGSVTNLAGATISGGNSGVSIEGVGAVINTGIITGAVRAGVYLEAGSVTNRAGGTISGGAEGVHISLGGGTVTNAGSITANAIGAIGVVLANGGSVTNQAGGSISGSSVNGSSKGIDISGGVGDVTNAGVITGGTYGIAVSLRAGGSVTNQAGGTVSAGLGVYIRGGGSVTNQAGGTISAGNYAGVYIRGGAGTVTNAGAITGGAVEGGIFLQAGGSVTNQAGGTIYGFAGVLIQGGAGTVTNQAGGVISGEVEGVSISGPATVTNAGNIVTTGANGYAVYLLAGGSVTNQGGGTIGAASVGVFIRGGAGAVTNAGNIAAATGVDLEAGGSVTNQAGGTISGIQNGVFVTGGAGTVTNAGVITGTGDRGVQLDAGGSVTNLAGGTISGEIGISFASGTGTMTNAGTITGTGGIAVEFDGSGVNTLILQTGSMLNGDAVGSLAGGATNALVLQGIGRADNAFLNFNTLDVQASGRWALNGVSAFDATTIESGTLVVGDPGHSGAALISDITINAGGALAGAGTVIGNVGVLAGGAIAPGAAGSFSTLTVNGNATFDAGSFYRINVSGAQNDRLVLSGSAALGGATLQTVYVGGVQHNSYNILHADGGLGGSSFAAVSSNWSGLTQTVSYTPTDVFLTLSAAQLGAGADLNCNQRNVADSINNFFNAGGNLPPGFGGLFALNGPALGAALNQLSGEAATGAQTGGMQMMASFLGLMNDPTTDGRGGAGGGTLGFAPERTAVPGDIRQAYAAVLKAPPVFDQRWNVWGSGFGGGSKIDGDAAVGSSNVSAKTYGVAAGADYLMAPNTRIGFALAGGATNWNLAQGLGGGTGNAFQAGVYGKTSVGPAYLAASLAVANHWMSTSRTAFGGSHLNADFEAQSYGGRIEGGYRFATALAGITPYAAAQAQLFRTPAYSESDPSGGNLGLGYAARDATATRAEFGSRFDRDLALVNTDAVMTLRGRLGWAHDWISDPRLLATFQALPGASFVVTGAKPAADYALVSAGTELRWRTGWALAVKLDGEFASQVQTYTGTGTLRYQW